MNAQTIDNTPLDELSSLYLRNAYDKLADQAIEKWTHDSLVMRVNILTELRNRGWELVDGGWIVSGGLYS